MSGPVNYDDVISQLANAGLIIQHLEIGRMRRCQVQGSKERKGWYAIHEVTMDGGDLLLVGSYGIWQGANNNATKIELKKQKLTDDQKSAIKTRLADDKRRAEAARRREQDSAAKRAEMVWRKAATEGQSEYLKRKQVQAHGIRYTESGALVIPMTDSYGKIHGLQFILPAGHPRKKKTGRDKEFWPVGMGMRGHYFLIGAPVNILLIAEGYATAASLHAATGLPCAVAFNANNLLPVAEALRRRYPHVGIVMCADDDYIQKCTPCGEMTLVDSSPDCEHCGKPHGKNNAGQINAGAAALAVNGKWLAPVFTIDRERKKITDFNDLHVLEGLHLVRSQIEAVTVELWAGAKVAQLTTTIEGAGQALKSLLSVPEAVDRFSLIYGAGGSLFDHQENALISKTDVLDICVDHAWREWKLNMERKVVRLSEVGFDPTGNDLRIKCNIWGGWPTKPRAGSCEILLDLLRTLCSLEENSSETIYQWVLKWLAYPIQHPGAKMRSALIFHGPQGAGKNLFFEAYAAIYGKYGRVIGQAELEDKFNDWASGMLFMIADEVVARQELYHTKNKIKALITGEYIRINPKNVAAHDERNHVNIVFLSNEKQPAVLEKDDRRFAVIWTPEKLPDNYYADVAEEIKAGGIDALHDYLLNLELGNFNEHTKPPVTRSKQDLIDINLDSVERFMTDWTNGDLGLPVVPCSSEDIYKAYNGFCKRNGVTRPRELNQVIGNIAKTPGWDKDRPRVYRDMHYRGDLTQVSMVIPPDPLISIDQRKQDGQKTSEWLTVCYLEFRNKLGGPTDDR